MTFRPKIQNKISCTVFCFLLFVVFFCILLQSNAQSYIWVYQIFILIFSVAALEVLLKYILSDYVYELKDDKLRIFRIQGKKSVCVASIALSTAYGPVEKSLLSKHAIKQAKVKLNYCKNMYPESYYIFNFDFNGKNTVLKFEPDSIFVQAVNKQIELSKISHTERNKDDHE